MFHLLAENSTQPLPHLTKLQFKLNMVESAIPTKNWHLSSGQRDNQTRQF